MTIDDLFTQLIGPKWAALKVLWPPDAFALCASVLQRSGAYTHVVGHWPPRDFAPQEYTQKMRRYGKAWRDGFDRPLPVPVRRWWKIVVRSKAVEISDLRHRRRRHFSLIESLLLILAAADEASKGIGIFGLEAPDRFEKYYAHSVSGYGLSAETVCDKIPPNALRVLPKLHTPQAGLTIRSLSHHLALCPTGEVTPRFLLGPTSFRSAPRKIQVLLVPWPEFINDEDFSPVSSPIKNLPPNFGFFNFSPNNGKRWPKARLEKIFQTAEQVAGGFDAVIFPELALHDKDLSTVHRQLKAVPRPQVLIAGVHQPQKNSPFASNSAVTLLPLDSTGSSHIYSSQTKHHRWQLNASQIEQYHLSRSLDPKKIWWEASSMPARELNFFLLYSRITLSVLVCEDLARQDPVSDIVRAVGPNLVVSLLMDGPQLGHRWPARYATVLADDPGSSVLTLTSLGMVRRSRCLGKPESRVIALWKDAHAGPYEIDLPYDAQAVVLTLELEDYTEYTADGRPDDFGATRVLLKGMYYVRLKSPNYH
jgi:hypothetical protein